jgi:hypothetical protein
MAMPPTPASQNAVIVGGSAKPVAGDLGMFQNINGGIITGMTTEFPFTHDVYHDIYMNRIADVIYDQQFVVNVDFQVMDKAIAAEDDHSPSRDKMLTEVDVAAIDFINYTDTRGFAGSSGSPAATAWAAGVSFLLTEGGGTFERNKPRMDRLKYEFRRYAAV